MWEELGSGNVLNATQISNLISGVPDNTRVQLTLNLRASPAGWMVTQLQNDLASQGIPGVKVSTGSPILNISWIHNASVSSQISGIALGPLAIVAIIVVALAVIAVVVVGWLVYKDVPTVLKPAVIVAGIALIGLIVYAVVRSEVSKYA
jgi:hypothetical protein